MASNGDATKGTKIGITFCIHYTRAPVHCFVAAVSRSLSVYSAAHSNWRRSRRRCHWRSPPSVPIGRARELPRGRADAPAEAPARRPHFCDSRRTGALPVGPARPGPARPTRLCAGARSVWPGEPAEPNSGPQMLHMSRARPSDGKLIWRAPNGLNNGLVRSFRITSLKLV